MTTKPTHKPHIEGYISSDDAIADIMRISGMTRRNAVRFFKKGLLSGELKIKAISKTTGLPVETTPERAVRQIDIDEGEQ